MKKESIGERVKRLRKALGWNQETLAKRAGLGRSTISKIEAGNRAPETATINALAGALGETINEICFGMEPVMSGQAGLFGSAEIIKRIPESLGKAMQKTFDQSTAQVFLRASQGEPVTGIVAPDGSPGPGIAPCIYCGEEIPGGNPVFCPKCRESAMRVRRKLSKEADEEQKKEEAKAFFRCRGCGSPFVSTEPGICEKCMEPPPEKEKGEKRNEAILSLLPKMEKADLRVGLFVLLYQIMTDDPDAECRRMAIEGAVRIVMEKE